VSTDVDEFLAHYGTVGMKWGVRKDKSGMIKPRGTIQVDKENPKPNKLGWEGVFRDAAPKISRDTRALNKDPRFSGQDFTKDSPLRQAYYNQYSNIVAAHMTDAIPKKHGRSPSKAFEAYMTYDVRAEKGPILLVRLANDPSQQVIFGEVKHSVTLEDSGSDFVLGKLTFDDFGYIVDVKLIDMEETMQQSEEFIEDFLMHHGVKGMKWGVIRSKISKATASRGSKEEKPKVAGATQQGKDGKPTNDPLRYTIKPGQKTRAMGGENYPADHDAIRSAVHKQLARASTTDALSDAQLKALVNRMNLEEQYKKLAPKTRTEKVLGFATDLLVSVGKEQATRVVKGQATKKIDAMFVKAAATAVKAAT